MNIYLYPVCINGGKPEIRKVVAKGYNECLDKIEQNYLDSIDELEDTFEDFDDFCATLVVNYDINIGDVVELEQFN